MNKKVVKPPSDISARMAPSKRDLDCHPLNRSKHPILRPLPFKCIKQQRSINIERKKARRSEKASQKQRKEHQREEKMKKKNQNHHFWRKIRDKNRSFPLPPLATPSPSPSSSSSWQENTREDGGEIMD